MRCLGLAGLFLGVISVAHAQGLEWVYGDGPFAGGNVVAVHPDGDIFSILDGDLYVSWDEGRNWRLRSSYGLRGSLVVRADGVMFGLDENGIIIRSTNHGGTWEEVVSPKEELDRLAISFGGVICVATDVSAYCSTDLEFWDEYPIVAEDELISRLAIVDGVGLFTSRWWDGGGGPIEFIMRFDVDVGSWVYSGHSEIGKVGGFIAGLDGRFYVTARAWTYEFGSFDGGVFRWSDQQSEWEQLHNGTTLGAFVFPSGELIIATPDSLLWDGPQSLSSPLGIIVRTANDSFMANTTTGYRCFGDYEGALYCPQSSGAYRLDENVWHQAGTVPAKIFSLEESPEGDLLVGTERGVYSIAEGGWVAAGWNYGHALAMETVLDSVYVAGWQYENTSYDGGLFRLGANWPVSIPGDCQIYGCSVYTVLESEAGTLLVTVDNPFDDGGLYRSVDGGENWIQTLVDIREVRSLHQTDSGDVLAGVRNAGSGQSGIYRSRDDGQTWNISNSGLTNTEVHSLYSSSGIEFAGTEDGIFVSFSGGSWLADGVPSDTVYAFTDAADGVLAGTASGLFRRTAPNMWESYGTGLEDRSVLSLLVTEFEGEELIVAGTDAGVYFSRPGLITVEREQPARPISATRLHPPFPNPAHDLVTLRFDLEQSAYIRIRAFDTLGREVAKPVDGQFQAGSHQTTWRVSGLASGVYLLRIEAGDMHSTQRVIVLR